MEWSLINWILIGIYLLITLFFGFFFNKRNKTTKEYFLAGKVPSWVNALSIYATLLSSLSFMAITASIFYNGLVIVTYSFGVMLIIFLIGYFAVPFFRKLKSITSYQYLGMRFSPIFQTISSISYILFHIVYIAVIIYLPSAALKLILPDVNIIYITLAVAFFCIFYSALGGLEGVAWSDAIQAIIFISSAFIVIFIGYQYIPEAGWYQTLVDGKKMLSANDFRMSLEGNTFWAVVFGQGFVGSINVYISSQNMYQRFKATDSTIKAQKSVYFNFFFLISNIVILGGMATALYFFYNFSGNPLPKEFAGGTTLLPYFVIKYVPTGLSAIVIIAIFAASQSTISSSISSIASCVVNDFIYRNKIIEDKEHKEEDNVKLKVSKQVSFVVGALSVVIAYYFLTYNITDAFAFYAVLNGVLLSPLAVLFILAMFFKDINYKPAFVGLVVSYLVAFYLVNPFGVLGVLSIKVSSYFTPLIVLIIGLIAAYIAKFIPGFNNKYDAKNYPLSYTPEFIENAERISGTALQVNHKVD